MLACFSLFATHRSGYILTCLLIRLYWSITPRFHTAMEMTFYPASCGILVSPIRLCRRSLRQSQQHDYIMMCLTTTHNNLPFSQRQINHASNKTNCHADCQLLPEVIMKFWKLQLCHCTKFRRTKPREACAYFSQVAI